jgi:hypothetical protein
MAMHRLDLCIRKVTDSLSTGCEEVNVKRDLSTTPKGAVFKPPVPVIVTPDDCSHDLHRGGTYRYCILRSYSSIEPSPLYRAYLLTNIDFSQAPFLRLSEALHRDQES